MSSAPPVVLTTDFGTADPYVGVMKGVIFGINPAATVIDLTHEIGPQDIRQAAFILAAGYRYFPAGTVHVVVVDPGVGTPRDAVLLTTANASFLAPDNGVLSYLLARQPGGQPPSAGRTPLPPGVAAYRLTNPAYWVHPVSSTFHGRDVFAPVAAHLSLGVSPESVGEPVDDLVWLPRPVLERSGNTLRGEVVYADRFGNLITSVPAAALEEGEVSAVEIKGRRIPRLSRTFHDPDAPPEEDLLALLGSGGYLEIAQRDGSAAAALGAEAGEAIHVTLASRPGGKG